MANKPDWLNERSAVIPYFTENNTTKVVLVTTKPKENNNWIFPKGQVELGMTTHDSAAKEAFEEAGVAGHISSKAIDEYLHEKWGGKMCIKVYSMEVARIYDTWLEMNERERTVVTLDEAIKLVQSVQKQSLKKFKKLISK